MPPDPPPFDPNDTPHAANNPLNVLGTRMVVALSDNTQLLTKVGQVLEQLCDLLEGVKNQYGIIDFLQGVEGKMGLLELMGDLTDEMNGVKDEFWVFNRAMEMLKDHGVSKPSWGDFCRAYYEAIDDDEKRKKEEEADDGGGDDNGDDWKKGRDSGG